VSGWLLVKITAVWTSDFTSGTSALLIAPFALTSSRKFEGVRLAQEIKTVPASFSTVNKLPVLEKQTNASMNAGIFQHHGKADVAVASTAKRATQTLPPTSANM